MARLFVVNMAPATVFYVTHMALHYSMHGRQQAKQYHAQAVAPASKRLRRHPPTLADRLMSLSPVKKALHTCFVSQQMTHGLPALHVRSASIGDEAGFMVRVEVYRRLKQFPQISNSSLRNFKSRVSLGS